jgi:transposase InsO family protein
MAAAIDDIGILDHEPGAQEDPATAREGSARARLFLIVNDHSRLLVDGRFFAHENARACQDLLRRAVTRRGVPDVLYADNGAPFSNAWLARTCAVLGARLVHSQPYSPSAARTLTSGSFFSFRVVEQPGT